MDTVLSALIWKNKHNVRVVSEVYKKALKVQILNEVVLIQLVRKRVNLKIENKPTFPSLIRMILSSILTLLSNNLSHLKRFY